MVNKDPDLLILDATDGVLWRDAEQRGVRFVTINPKEMSPEEFDQKLREISGGGFGRPEDVIGLGLAFTMISDAYKNPSGLDGNEIYAEAYYNMTLREGFQVTPDIQYIVNPGGNSDQDAFVVYGVRAGVMF